jgi:multidrug efflux pump subunit AcrA (membrane-fusion protein)
LLEKKRKKNLPLKNNMKKNIFLLALSFALFGCGAEEEGETTQESVVKTVASEIVQRKTLTPTVSFSGTLLPESEASISAETSGTVYSVWANEGDEVFVGQTLLSFAAGDNLAQIDVENAMRSLADAEKALALTQQQVEKSVASAELSVDQAQSNLDSAKRTNYSTGTSAEAQKQAAQSSVELAQLNVENAEKSYTELLERLATNEKNINDTKDNAVSSALTVYRRVMSDADEILGVNPETKDGNNDFEVYLGFRAPQTKIDSVNLFRTAWSELKTLEETYNANRSEVTIAEMETVGNAIRTLLQKMDDMLKQSVSGIGFTEATLTSLQTQNSANRSTLDASLSSLTTTFGQIETFTTSKPQQIRAAELVIEQAKKQLKQSQSSLAQIESGTEVSLVGTENQVEGAKNGLATAKSQLEYTQKQNELAVQQAISAKNNALSSLRRAQIQAGKLVVTAPNYGIVTAVNIDAGDTVTAGTPLFSVANINSLILKGEMDPNMLSAVRVGIPAQIYIDGFEVQQATVTKVHPVANEATRRIPVEISLENKNLSIPANIFAKAVIPLPAEEDIVLIPQNALVSQNPAAVFVLTEKTSETGEKTVAVEKKEIQTGRTQKGEIEVLEGLLSGEIIIPAPVVGLKEGDIVKIQQ